MASMTDIVFLLLIFFMITSTLVTTNAIDILTPSTNKSQVPNKSYPKVFVDGSSNYYLDGKLISKESLERAIVQKVANLDKKVIILSVEEKVVPIENTVFVMDIANKNHIKAVFSAKPNK